MKTFDEEVREIKDWFASPRFEGIIRLFSARQVVEQRGTIATRSENECRCLWREDKMFLDHIWSLEDLARAAALLGTALVVLVACDPSDDSWSHEVNRVYCESIGDHSQAEWRQ